MNEISDITNNLKIIISDNMKTEFGKNHNFDKIKSYADYVKYVPLSDYSDYRSYIDEMTEKGTNPLTAYSVYCFCKSSGTEGFQKTIPLTEKAINLYGCQIEKGVMNLYESAKKRAKQGSRFLVNTFRTDLDEPAEKYMLLSEAYYRFLYLNGYISVDNIVGGKELLFDKKSLDFLYAKVWSAILTKDIISIEGIFQYDILLFFGYLSDSWERIISDIRRGSIPDNINISERMKKKLLNMPVSFQRLDYVYEQCKKGFENIAPRLWKNLSFISGIGYKDSLSENRLLSSFVGNVKKYYFSFCSSECYSGNAVTTDSFAYELIKSNGFYEFIEYDCDCPNESTDVVLQSHELDVGKTYELVVTNFSGLYRYKTGDILRITDMSGKLPLYEFVRRKNHNLNIAGEKTNSSHIEYIIKKLSVNFSELISYCFGTIMEEHKGRYIAFISFRTKPHLQEEKKVSNLLDRLLCEINLDYNDLRILGSVLPLKAIILTENDYNLQIKKVFSNHRHNKPIHFLSEQQTQMFMKGVSVNE